MYSSPGVFDELIHLYAATGLKSGTAQPEPDEEIELMCLKLEKAFDLIISGEIVDAKTMIALYRWQTYQQNGATRPEQ